MTEGSSDNLQELVIKEYFHSLRSEIENDVFVMLSKREVRFLVPRPLS